MSVSACVCVCVCVHVCVCVCVCVCLPWHTPGTMGSVPEMVGPCQGAETRWESMFDLHSLFQCGST